MSAQCDVEPPPESCDPRVGRRERRRTVSHAKTVGGREGGGDFAQSKIVRAFSSVISVINRVSPPNYVSACLYEGTAVRYGF